MQIPFGIDNTTVPAHMRSSLKYNIITVVPARREYARYTMAIHGEAKCLRFVCVCVCVCRYYWSRDFSDSKSVFVLYSPNVLFKCPDRFRAQRSSGIRILYYTYYIIILLYIKLGNIMWIGIYKVREYVYRCIQGVPGGLTHAISP